MIGYIYKLWNVDDDKNIYIGSTRNMDIRLFFHKKCISENIINTKLYRHFRTFTDTLNLQMEVLETVDYEDNYELLVREEFHRITLNATLNMKKCIKMV